MRRRPADHCQEDHDGAVHGPERVRTGQLLLVRRLNLSVTYSGVACIGNANYQRIKRSEEAEQQEVRPERACGPMTLDRSNARMSPAILYRRAIAWATGGAGTASPATDGIRGALRRSSVVSSHHDCRPSRSAVGEVRVTSSIVSRARRTAAIADVSWAVAGIGPACEPRRHGGLIGTAQDPDQLQHHRPRHTRQLW